MAKWIQKAVPESHRGLATAAASREGLSVQEWARKHAHDPNPTTRGRAQFAMRARGGFGKKKRHSFREAVRSRGGS